MAAGPIAEIVNMIKLNSTSAASLGQLVQQLRSREDELVQQLPAIDSAVEALDPAQHTLGLVFILSCKAGTLPLSQPPAVNVFLHQCRTLLLTMDAVQARMLAKELVAICNKFAAAAISAKQALMAILPLRAAAFALQPSPSHFTPLHAECLKLCLVAKAYHAAEPILAQELRHVSKKETELVPRDLLLFHYYAGMVEVGLKRYRSALDLFLLCVSAPTHVLNSIMLEAYKKALLCSLIESGEPPKLPKHTSPMVSRAIKSQLAPYKELQDAFASGKPEGLRSAIQKRAVALGTDHNLGLAKQCYSALLRRSVRKLTETYLTLSLTSIATWTGLPDADSAEKAISEMIEHGLITATIDQLDGIVTFHDGAENDSPLAQLPKMEMALAKAKTLAGTVHQLHTSLASDPNCISRIVLADRGGEAGPVGVGAGAGEPSAFDDAVMGGLGD